MIRSEKAVSEVIGMVIILAIMMLVIGSIMIVGVPMIDSGKYRARMDVAANSFLSLQNDIEEVVRGPIWVKDPMEVTNVSRLGPSRETEFQLMGGSLSVVPDPDVFEVTIVTDPATNKKKNFTGVITYMAGQEEIAYENGAIIRKYEAGSPLMLSDPLITIYNTLDNNSQASYSNITVSIHAINITGRLSSAGGDGKAWIETRPVNYSQIMEPQNAPTINLVNITIYSKYPEAWNAFFDEKLKGSGLIKSNNRNNITGYYLNSSQSPLEVLIFGTNTNSAKKDIFFSVYETELDAKVR